MKEVITSEISEYLKNLINPIAEENKKTERRAKDCKYTTTRRK